MTIVGGLDVHRQQITFDYVDDDGLVHWGQIRSGDAENVAGLAGREVPRRQQRFRAGGLHGVAVRRWSRTPQ